MTASTLINGTEVRNEHTATGNRLVCQVEGNLDGCRIELKQRNALGVESGFDDPDGKNIRGTGIRDLTVGSGTVVYPEFNGGRVAGNITVTITDA